MNVLSTLIVTHKRGENTPSDYDNFNKNKQLLWEKLEQTAKHFDS